MQRIKKINYQVITKLLATALFFMALMPWKVNATHPAGDGFHLDDGVRGTGTSSELSEVFQLVANVMLAVIGAVAVIMLIVGGFRYVVSGGDSTAIEGAKNTILYAIIGIVVAFLAFAAINFLVGELEQ